ncbi:MAG: EVE domain-containing protein [Phycisphaeraceae bacterium]|nr:EVE domain-containing protein [Phycisphaerales bacterium]QOJ17149.1 MAG: EVE domain-containing protein [Phycisphaeraceae bacterium]
MPRQYWLMKSEPASYSIDDLQRDGVSCWDGVRNYQARNFMRDEMKVGDEALFYHSGSDGPEGEPGVAGVMRIAAPAYPDHHALDPDTCDHDPKATKDNNPWLMVDVEFVEKFPNYVPLRRLRAEPRLQGLALLQRGQRLSILPVSRQHFDLIRKMGKG